MVIKHSPVHVVCTLHANNLTVYTFSISKQMATKHKLTLQDNEMLLKRIRGNMFNTIPSYLS